MRYYIALLLTLSLNAQTLLTETFSDFTPDTTGANFVIVLDNMYRGTDWLKDIMQDRTLSVAGWANAAQAADSLKDGSFIFSGGKGLKFTQSAANYLSIGNALVPDINPGTGDFSIMAWIKAPQTFSVRASVLSKDNASGLTSKGYVVYLTMSAPNPYDVYSVRDGSGVAYLDFTNNDRIAGDAYHTLALTADRDGNISTYLDATVKVSNTVTNSVDITNTESLTIGKWSTRYYESQIFAVAYYPRSLTEQEVRENTYLASGWKSLNSGVTRANWGFNQGVVNDTIYYNTALSAGSWSVTLSDSAASGVNYEVLTSADATTWTTLATGTTGTSWGSKSYSGTGTGYVAISVASGTAFFDDLVVTLEGGKKTKYSGFNGWNKY